MKNKFYTYIQNLQDQICKGLEDIDGSTKFREDICLLREVHKCSFNQIRDYLIEQKEKLNEKEGKKKSKKSPKISEIDSIAFALMQKLGINL